MSARGSRQKPELTLKVAVISDLHAFRRPKEAMPDPSKLCISDSESNPVEHPVTGLLELVKKEGIRSDLLLCPGDMTYQADPEGTRYSWTKLQDIGAAIGAGTIAGTAGNHDLDSRGVANSEEPKETLQSLSPSFPIANDTLCNEYWARHVTVLEDERYRLLLLNSCAKHSGASKEELERGSISRQTLEYLQGYLRKQEAKRINLLLCHHHPHAHSELHLGHVDVMERGQLLLDLLAEYGDWIVVHGHKHHPKISYAAGGSGWPVVFASGSFSGNFGTHLESRTRNLFHVVEIYQDGSARRPPMGIVRSWYWAAGLGWKSCDGSAAGLPRETGFGDRTHPRDMAHLISTHVKVPALKSWDELCQRLPQLRFRTPQDYFLTREYLQRNHGLRIIELDGMPHQVGSTS
jgi:hypothetical protein